MKRRIARKIAKRHINKPVSCRWSTWRRAMGRLTEGEFHAFFDDEISLRVAARMDALRRILPAERP